MGYVIGPISPDEWYTLRQLKSSIKWYKRKDPSRFKLAIDKESSTFNSMMKECVKRRAA